MIPRVITCHRCMGSGELTNIISERTRRCPACRGHGTVDVHCTIVRPPIRVDEPTPLASAILDAGGQAVDL